MDWVCGPDLVVAERHDKTGCHATGVAHLGGLTGHSQLLFLLHPSPPVFPLNPAISPLPLLIFFLFLDHCDHGPHRQAELHLARGTAIAGGSRAHPVLEKMGSLCLRETVGYW